MGMLWRIINIDKPSSQDISKISEFIFRDMPQESLLSKLVPTPAINIPPVKEEIVQIVPRTVGSSAAPSLIARCPVEVVDLFAGNIEAMTDCVFFSLTCRRHWNIGRLHAERLIRRYVDQESGSWAGDRIVMIGEGLCWQHLPEGLLTESDKERLGVDWGSRGVWEGQQDLYTATGWESDFCRASDPNFEIVRHDVRQKLALSLVDYTDGSFLPAAMWDDLKLLDRLLGPSFLQVPKFKPLVLRNLTKHVYVREDAVRQFEVENGDMLEELEHHFNLGHVVFMRIFPFDDDEFRCEWAGDRFDLVSFADVTKEVNEQAEGWKDVTEEVINEMRDIWLRPGF